MEVILSPDQMRAYDRHAIRTLSIPGHVLMENAGAGVANIVKTTYGPLASQHIVVVCGKGNNGGDGLVIARHLIDSGARLTVVLIAKPSEFQGEARLNFKILSALAKSSPGLEIKTGIAALAKITHPHLVIDAIFGTGFSGLASGVPKKAIEWINKSGAPVVSVDIPSGLDALTGSVAGVAVKANLTVTMAFRKTGMLLNSGPEHCGRVSVVPIGATRNFPRQIRPDTYGTDAESVASAIPDRTRTTHKYSILKTAVIAGSRGMTGAPLMTCKALLRVGGGLVRLCTPGSAAAVVSNALPEAMVTALAETPQGALSMECLPQLREVLSWADVIVIGPGLSKDPSTQELVRTVLSETDKPIVLDADGLNAVNLKFLGKLNRKSTLILTPHVAEASRFSGISSTEIERSRGSIAAGFAKSAHAVVALKGAPTVVGSPDGISYINTTGNPNLATPGSGDILTGIIGALLAQGLAPLDATLAGVFLHGKAADRLRDAMGDRGLLASDLVNELPNTLHEIRVSRGN